MKLEVEERTVWFVTLGEGEGARQIVCSSKSEVPDAIASLMNHEATPDDIKPEPKRGPGRPRKIPPMPEDNEGPGKATGRLGLRGPTKR